VSVSNFSLFKTSVAIVAIFYQDLLRNAMSVTCGCTVCYLWLHCILCYVCCIKCSVQPDNRIVWIVVCL